MGRFRMPMARSASHAAHCVRKGETPSRSQEDLMDHWSTTQIGQKGWNFLTSLQGEMQVGRVAGLFTLLSWRRICIVVQCSASAYVRVHGQMKLLRKATRCTTRCDCQHSTALYSGTLQCGALPEWLLEG